MLWYIDLLRRSFWPKHAIRAQNSARQRVDHAKNELEEPELARLVERAVVGGAPEEPMKDASGEYVAETKEKGTPECISTSTVVDWILGGRKAKFAEE